jgi:hypothetical protein
MRRRRRGQAGAPTSAMRYRTLFEHLVAAASSTAARRMLFFLGLLLVATPLADAARVKQSIVACHDEVSVKNLAEAHGKPNNKQPVSPATQKPKTMQPCSDLPQGMTVTVEQTDGQFLCVRPWGGLECLWTKSEAIDQNAQRAPASPNPLWGKAHFNGFKPSFTTQF